jgi:hypothetical protein
MDNAVEQPTRLTGFEYMIIAGLSEAVVRALGIASKRLRMKLLRMCNLFLNYLSQHPRPAAMAVLVAGDVAEFTVQEIIEGGERMHFSGVSLLTFFCTEPGSGERLCTPPLVDTLMKWIEERLPKVRDMIGSWGDVTETDTVCVLWFLYNASEAVGPVIPLAEPLPLVVGACIRFAQS